MIQRVLIAGDLHIPYHDPDAVLALLRFAKRYNPTDVVVHGDLIDFEALSRFLKDPREVSDPQDELDAAREFLQALRKAAPKANRYFGIGNHEVRLQKFLQRQAQPLLGLRSLDIKELLGLKEWQVFDYGCYVRIGDLVVMHGTGYGATVNVKNISKFGGFNVVQGHSHRLSQRFVRSIHGVCSAVETGCLCDLSPHYTHEPDWQQGFATYDGRHLHTHLIQEGAVQ